MGIDWAAFTPWHALAGGALIGLSAGALVLVNGRIAGISGILGQAISHTHTRASAWRWCFLAGLLAAAPLWITGAGLLALPLSRMATSTPMLVLAGLLVGVGTRLASGCTSGHGVCGLSRGSFRSLVATLAFMAAGFLTVYGVRHVFAS